MSGAVATVPPYSENFRTSGEDNEGFESEPSTPPSESNGVRLSSILRSNGSNTVTSPIEDTNQPHQVTFEMSPVDAEGTTPKAAVLVRNGCKRYGKGPKVLRDFNMSVEKGTIYSLLGSSGCGKTTILSCIVGIKRLNEGDILVFGAKPGTKESGIPGKRVGYMPQELALYGDFSIAESLTYFGRLYSMDSSSIKERQNFLIGFLELPEASRRVGTLSGGQKRRVSLSLAMIHSPELLILDEPTVGVDALLRESIWNHLIKMVSSQNTTVIITTHYIEEARQSNTVGVMRGGRLLAETSPESLFQLYGTTVLEDIVLKLSREDVVGTAAESCDTTQREIMDKMPDGDLPSDPYRQSGKSSWIPPGKRRMSMAVMQKYVPTNSETKDALNRVAAVIGKNIVVMMRNFILVLFMIGVPSMLIFLICMAIGNDPRPMWMGLVNHETDTCITSRHNASLEGCDIENLSCQYLSKLPSDIIYLREYATEEEARAGVDQGDVWGLMVFAEGFSDHVYTRAASGNIIDNETLYGANIYTDLDYSNKQIALTLKRVIGDAYKDFARELLEKCGFPPELAESPVQFRNSLYGSDDTDFTEFVAPSLLLGVLFFFPLCSSAVQIILDKKLGTLERARVAGVKMSEIMLAFFCTEGLVLIIQSVLSFSIITVLFGIPIHGSRFLAVSLGVLIGLGGVSMGFLISSFCTEEVEAVILAMAAYFPNFLLSGMMWPTEGMPVIMQYVALLLPCTFGCEAMRSIVSRGWTFTHIKVWPGFVTIFGWIAVYWIITVCIYRFVLSKR